MCFTTFTFTMGSSYPDLARGRFASLSLFPMCIMCFTTFTIGSSDFDWARRTFAPLFSIPIVYYVFNNFHFHNWEQLPRFGSENIRTIFCILIMCIFMYFTTFTFTIGSSYPDLARRRFAPLLPWVPFNGTNNILCFTILKISQSDITNQDLHHFRRESHYLMFHNFQHSTLWMTVIIVMRSSPASRQLNGAEGLLTWIQRQLAPSWREGRLPSLPHWLKFSDCNKISC